MPISVSVERWEPNLDRWQLSKANGLFTLANLHSESSHMSSLARVCVCVCVCVCVRARARIQSCSTLCSPMDCSHQAHLFMEFFRQEYWSGLPFPFPGDYPNPGFEPTSVVSPVLKADSWSLSHWESLMLTLENPSRLCFSRIEFSIFSLLR